MFNSNPKRILAQFPNTHYFVYRKQKYPFNFKLFNFFTDYFENHMSDIRPDNSIPLIKDESIDLSKEGINAFINFCQHQPITISNDISITLKYLSTKYQVQNLIEQADSYILQHQNELVLQLLLFYQNDSSAKGKYEDKISQNFSDYLSNEKLVTLPIPVLHRIFTKSLKINKNIPESEIFDFLFKCLRKYGREASVLFDEVNFSNVRSDTIHRLMTEFSDVFDFHFINPVFMQTIYEQQNEIIRKLDEIKTQQEQQIAEIKEENQKLRSIIVEKPDIMNMIHDEMTRYLHYRLFQYDGKSEHSFNGIIRYLTKICNGNVFEKGFIEITSSPPQSNFYKLQTIVDSEDKMHYFATANEKNSWIKFDFKSHSIRPTFYSFRSRHDFKYQNPQKWVVEGSNSDGSGEWKILDSRENVKCLDGLNFQYTFEVQIAKSETEEGFRYIRIRQTGNNLNGDNVFVLSAIEFFGYLY